MKNLIRLDKFLADAGVGTRSEVKKYIQKGRVQVNGVCVRKSEAKVEVSHDEITFDGVRIEAAPEFVYYLLNKPAGVVTATEDQREKTVMDLIDAQRKGLFPVGRLDKDTEGLLLITDDGQLSHQLLSPKKHVWKTYYAKVEGSLIPDAAQAVEEGLDIGDEKKTLPAKLSYISRSSEERICEILLEIHEGRFHQVKRMVEVLGGNVVYLKRLSMGSLQLPDDLPPGHFRELTNEEVAGLKTGLNEN